MNIKDEIMEYFSYLNKSICAFQNFFFVKEKKKMKKSLIIIYFKL